MTDQISADSYRDPILERASNRTRTQQKESGADNSQQKAVASGAPKADTYEISPEAAEALEKAKVDAWVNILMQDDVVATPNLDKIKDEIKNNPEYFSPDKMEGAIDALLDDLGFPQEEE